MSTISLGPQNPWEEESGGQFAAQLAAGQQPAASDASDGCTVYQQGVKLTQTSVPAGHWLVVDEADNVLISGADLVAVYEKGVQLGLDMEELALDRAATADGVEFLERGGSVFLED